MVIAQEPTQAMKQSRKMKGNPIASKLQELLALRPAERLEAVVRDLVTREDKFREIEAHQEILIWLKEAHEREHMMPPYQTKAVIQQKRASQPTAE